MIKLLYKPASMLASLAGGMLASAVFKKVWKLTAGEDEAPEATDAAKGWPEILIAAALQGAIFAVVRALVERLTAAGTRSLTGTWPGQDSNAKKEETASS
jgi:uncharacterized protein YidB (DUF937 family)